MTHFWKIGGYLGLCCVALSVRPVWAADAPAAVAPNAAAAPAPAPVPEVKVDLGKATTLSLDYGLPNTPGFVLSGRDAHQQLAVTATYASGDLRDISRTVSYETSPAGIVTVDSSGVVLPVAEGQAMITVKSSDGLTASTGVTVKDLIKDKPVNFPNQVVPVFTKLGCNSGGCHGKASGQNGFRLSLLGFEPTEDYEHLLKEGRGRRLFPAAPERSLLLTKATGTIPHGGGPRMELDSPYYKLVVRWITQGMPYGLPTDPVLTNIDIFPHERTMVRSGEQQLVVTAHYSDGSTADVTSTTKFEPNDPEMAEAGNAGLIKTLKLNGTVAIMARYQGQVAVFRASIPLGANTDKIPQPKNFIDELVFKNLKTLGIPTSDVCDDATYIRRVTVDLAGRIPSAAETDKFLADKDPAKREHLVDALLASGDYADYFANKWGAILRNKRRMEDYARGTYLFHDWIRESLNDNKPYDQFVREILTAQGEISENPPVAWYREVKENNQQLEDTAQLFLGMRIQCARCHHHPYEKWSQQDYYGFEAFFTQIGRKKGSQPDEERIFHKRGLATATNLKTKLPVKPTGLDSKPLDLTPDQDPREALVDWMVNPNNPFFAAALTNRYWKHFFGRGLVDPEDDMRVTNPASNPELLHALAKYFIGSGFNLKDLCRTICTSTTYQLSAQPNQFNLGDKQNYSRYYPKRLNAEVLLDAIDTVCESTSRFQGMPEGTRAVQLPDTSFNSYFLTVFGRPEASSASESERSSEANLAQSLHLLNSTEVQQKLTGGGRSAKLAADKRPHPQRLRDLYLQVYSREPLPEEVAVAMNHIEKTKNDKTAYEDILWALINTKEFLFNH
ncbi:MAG TPA: DUF1549 domain-containing protein [Pirellulales bacterium]|jgi:hypothetical protein|nr:DUF1549 domain-containing protein [Pirellulales bacterium]